MVYNPYQKCLSCGYEWKSRTSIPKMCPRCKTRKIEIAHEKDETVIMDQAFNRIRHCYEELINIQRRCHEGFINKQEQIEQSKIFIATISSSIKKSLYNDFIQEGK